MKSALKKSVITTEGVSVSLLPSILHSKQATCTNWIIQEERQKEYIMKMLWIIAHVRRQKKRNGLFTICWRPSLVPVFSRETFRPWVPFVPAVTNLHFVFHMKIIWAFFIHLRYKENVCSITTACTMIRVRHASRFETWTIRYCTKARGGYCKHHFQSAAE